MSPCHLVTLSSSQILWRLAMPIKKDLAALPSETPQLPLRRGRGLRLSQASKQARELASKSSGSPQISIESDRSAPIAQPKAELAGEMIASAEAPSPPALVAAENAVAAAP